MQKYRSVHKNSIVIKSFPLYGNSLNRNSFSCKTMGEKREQTLSFVIWRFNNQNLKQPKI